MAVKDTHKAFERLTSAGYSKEMTEALLDILGGSWDDLVTKDYLDMRLSKLDMRLRELESRLELRLTLRFGVMLAAATSVMIAVLLVLELLPAR